MKHVKCVSNKFINILSMSNASKPKIYLKRKDGNTQVYIIYNDIIIAIPNHDMSRIEFLLKET